MAKRSLTLTIANPVQVPAGTRRLGRPRLCLVVLGIWGSLAAFGQNPASRPAFEVASVKEASTDASGPSAIAKAKMEVMMLEIQNNREPGFLPKNQAHLTLRNRSLLSLIATAYKVRSTQVIGPPWISDLLFDIEAKMPEGAPAGDANEMLQSLLEERFGLRIHRENKTLPGYGLLVGKNGPKLTPSDTAANTEAKAAMTPDEMKAAAEAKLNKLAANLKARGMKDGGMSRRFQRVTTETLAQGIAQLIQSPVVDMTELTDRYDVNLEIPPPQDSADSIEGRVAQAVDKLGLRLERRKVPVEAVVVDSVAKTPTAN